MALFLQTLCFIVTVLIFLVLLWRVLANAGVPFKKTIPEPVRIGAPAPSTKSCIKVFGYSMLFRLFLLAASVAIYSLFVAQDDKLQWSQWLNNWLQWDARHYIGIADGYSSYVEKGMYPGLVFFPLYSFFLNLVNYLIPNAAISGLLVSAVASSVACVYLYKLVCLDYSRETAQISVLLLCLFPFGFFYSAIMSEGVFLCTSVMTLYFIRRHKWWLAGIFGCLAALSRSIGVFLVFPAAIELLEETRLLGNLKSGRAWLDALKKGCWILLFPVGTLIHLFINYQVTGDPLYFLAMEEKIWFQVSQPFYKIAVVFQSVFESGYGIPFLMATFIPALICLLFAYGLLIWGLNKHKTMYLCWLLISILVNTSISWPLSLCRYLASAVPIYIILSEECRNHPKLNMAVLISWSILFGIYFTGYLTEKSIM